MSVRPDNFVCAPLDTFEEIFEFLEEPPVWRSLCQELKPERHSKVALRNMDLCLDPDNITLEKPVNFCHYEPNDPDLPRHNKDKLPKTLVCHDMANGYHDDAAIHGSSNHEAYTFWNWGAVDIFCYFSHHLVTIPPVSWVNVGHAHGVKVIGTVITEWANGSIFWDRVLSSDQNIRKLASGLTSIAKMLRFDGWLLNIENKVADPLKLLEFVKLLHWMLHEELPNAELIWYDSVTIDGELIWQNQLNERNRPFFESCDGLFTNYSWRESEVARSAVVAGNRRTDVYVGVDVWGRNFFGGGQLNTQQAMKVIWREGLSVAIFAPAWTHEAAPRDSPRWHRTFLLRDAALWDSLWPYLHTRLPALLPFATAFCRGYGQKRYFYGEVVSPGPWFNLRHMQYQLNSMHGPHGYLVSTRQNLRALHLTESTIDLPALASAGDHSSTHRFSRNVSETGVSTVDNQSVATIVEKVDIGTNSIEKCNVGTERPPKRKVSFHLANLKVEQGVQNYEEIEIPVMRCHSGNDADFVPQRDTEPPVEVVDNSVETRTQGAPGPGGSYTIREADTRHAATIHVVPAAEERACATPYCGDAFSGGSSLAVYAGDSSGSRHRTARLLHCELRCGAALVVCAVSKRAPTAPRQQLDLLLHARASDGRTMRAVLLDTPLYSNDCDELNRVTAVVSALGSGWQVCKPLGTGGDFEALRRYLLLREPGFYVPRDNAFGWNVRYYWLEMGGGVVKHIGARCRLRRGPALLGHLALCHGPQKLNLEYVTSHEHFVLP